MGHYATPQKDSGLLFNPINWGIVGSSVAGPHSATPQYRKLLVFLLVLDVVHVKKQNQFVHQLSERARAARKIDNANALPTWKIAIFCKIKR